MGSSWPPVRHSRVFPCLMISVLPAPSGPDTRKRSSSSVNRDHLRLKVCDPSAPVTAALPTTSQPVMSDGSNGASVTDGCGCEAQANSSPVHSSSQQARSSVNLDLLQGHPQPLQRFSDVTGFWLFGEGCTPYIPGILLFTRYPQRFAQVRSDLGIRK